jgi:hypothetical protein
MRSSIRLDWEWATTTGGNLSRAEHRYLVGVILRDLPTALTALLRYRLGKRGTGRIDLGEVPVPTSTLARRAEQFVQQELSPLVLEHSYRTYYFGRVLAAGDGAEVDVEAVYLASLLHDLHLEHPTPGKCFAVTGAERTLSLMVEWGADHRTATKVAKAVCGHVTPGADRNLSDPAGFVLAGSLADIIGRRLDETDPSWLQELQQRYPRDGLKHQMAAALRAEGKAVPHGRVHLANRWAALPVLVQTAPYRQ